MASLETVPSVTFVSFRSSLLQFIVICIQLKSTTYLDLLGNILIYSEMSTFVYLSRLLNIRIILID